MKFLIILIIVLIPLGVYLWRESRYRNPAARWPQLARDLGFGFTPSPPRLAGQWKGRRILATAGQGESLVTTPLRCRTNIRVEVGPRAEVEQAAGMVVHDRVELGDSGFESRYLVRATPQELGGAAVDPAMRQRLMQMPDLRVLADPQELRVRAPLAVEAGELREFMDVAVAMADAIDGT